MKFKLKLVTAFILFISFSVSTFGQEVSLKITKHYLNFPVSHEQEKGVMTFTIGAKKDQSFKIRLAKDEPQYWVFLDVASYKGKTITISYAGDKSGLSKIYQDDKIAGQDSMYHEKYRPQFHFTTRRGWTNDPNGLIFFEGEYHMFYQHNPYEKEWDNMSWGHAVSKDLIHWQELPLALIPDDMGTIFSGTAVVDYNNTAGFNKGKTPAMVAFYTNDSPDKEVQCLAYSLDKGRTWTKYSGNPVIDSKAKWDSRDTRDPKVFWYKPGKHWVMVLNERGGHSIYNSTNLKNWTFESHIDVFWECPDMFELPVDGDAGKSKWVLMGASNTYMVGTFDGKTFKPEAGKFMLTNGTMYASQTFNNIPESDGRRIQIGWGRINQPNMPFNSMMLLPTELTLRNTKNGIRLFNVPVKEVETLSKSVGQWNNLTPDSATQKLKAYNDVDRLHIKTTLKLAYSPVAGIKLFGQNLLEYDVNFNIINNVFYSPENMSSNEITADIYIDRTSVEVFIDNGAYSYSLQRKPEAGNTEGFSIWGYRADVKNLEIFTVSSIWE